MNPCKCVKRVSVQDGELIRCDHCGGLIRFAQGYGPTVELTPVSDMLARVWAWDGKSNPSVEVSSLYGIHDRSVRNTLPDGTHMSKRTLRAHRDRRGEISHWTHPMSNGLVATIYND